MTLFGFSNGFNTTESYELARKEVPKKMIGKAGSCISFFLIGGIAFGAVYAAIFIHSLF